ncbi:MAG: hypothetical protein JXA15_05485 [Spirochaetales bacterium]|nr:hypothetical protein [Spirochaetales bacterium]
MKRGGSVAQPGMTDDGEPKSGSGERQLGLPRRGSAALAVLTLVLASLPCRTDAAGAQALAPAASRAVLLRSDPSGKGLPFFELPNAFPAHSAEYRVAGPGFVPAGADALSFTVRAWYSRAPVFLDSAWTAATCGAALVPGARTLERGFSPGRSVYAVEYPDYRVFVEAPSDWSDRCRFIAALASRVAYFIRYAPDPAGFSMPAVVEF